jgi:hypothetical protein
MHALQSIVHADMQAIGATRSGIESLRHGGN